jgi:protein TonB
MAFGAASSGGLSAPPAPTASPAVSRNALIAGGVVLFHVAALWALQTGLLRRAVEVVVPAEILSELIETAPKPAPPPPPAPPPAPAPRPIAQPVRKVAAAPAPLPVAIADPTPAPNAPTGAVAGTPPAPPAPVAAPLPLAPAAPPAPPAVQLPSTDADYLQNPKPVYPPMSQRAGEQGKVVVHVLIGADGNAQKVELRRSSGYERLDQAALATVQKWRYVPGKRNGVAEAMWFDVPINFVLE